MFSQENLGDDEKYAAVREKLAGDPSDGELTAAQELLDAEQERDAEWHHLQAAVHYFRRRYLDCRKQLEKAIKLDPLNPRYRADYDGLIAMSRAAKAEEQEKRQKATDGCAEGCCMGCCESLC